MLLLASVGCTSPDAAPSGGGDVVLITVDTLRPDHLSLFGYERKTTPHLEAWFGETGVLCERAYSTEANTPPSVVSLLSGLLPGEHRVRRFYQLLDRSVPLVSDLLPARYTKAAFVSNMVLTDEALGIASRFDHYNDRVTEHAGWPQVWERDAEDTTDAVLPWVREEAGRDTPLFLWVHYIDPHGPYDAPDGRFYDEV